MPTFEGGPHLILTGATGWLGKETLALLKPDRASHVLDLEYSVIPFSTKSCNIEFGEGNTLLTQTFQSHILPSQVEGVIQLSFLTRNKVEEVGFEKYVSENLEIISNICNLIEEAKPDWIILVSSGAVFASGSDEYEGNLQENPYGFLKRVEELAVAKIAAKMGSNLVIGRLWGASGEFMPINRAYALSDFILQAFEKSVIEIHSSHEVFRRYCDAGEFMEILIRLAKRGSDFTVDSGGELVELGDLAEEISEHFSEIAIERDLHEGVLADTYYPKGNEFERFASELKVTLANLATQVERTISGHSSQIKL